MAERALLLLADIAGYTEFMRLRLVEVEGDALFLSAPYEQPREANPSGSWLPAALAMYRAFHARQQWMIAHNLCVSDACRQIGKLHVKFVAAPRRRRVSAHPREREARRCGRDRRASDAEEQRFCGPSTS